VILGFSKAIHIRSITSSFFRVG